MQHHPGLTDSNNGLPLLCARISWRKGTRTRLPRQMWELIVNITKRECHISLTDVVSRSFCWFAKCADQAWVLVAFLEMWALPGSGCLHWSSQALGQGSALPPRSSYCLSETLSPFSPSFWKCRNTGHSLRLTFGSNAHPGSSCALRPLSITSSVACRAGDSPS